MLFLTFQLIDLIYGLILQPVEDFLFPTVDNAISIPNSSFLSINFCFVFFLKIDNSRNVVIHFLDLKTKEEEF